MNNDAEAAADFVDSDLKESDDSDWDLDSQGFDIDSDIDTSSDIPTIKKAPTPMDNTGDVCDAQGDGKAEITWNF
ncbi:hypothetical protein H0H92_011105 [Tricholoma furcatifolium]|nr:hypothetical protein H0H92_011105 [Tricholoma furcatifolium]